MTRYAQVRSRIAAKRAYSACTRRKRDKSAIPALSEAVLPFPTVNGQVKHGIPSFVMRSAWLPWSHCLVMFVPVMPTPQTNCASTVLLSIKSWIVTTRASVRDIAFQIHSCSIATRRGGGDIDNFLGQVIESRSMHRLECITREIKGPRSIVLSPVPSDLNIHAQVVCRRIFEIFRRLLKLLDRMRHIRE